MSWKFYNNVGGVKTSPLTTNTSVLSAQTLYEPGVSGQYRAGRVLTAADFTTLLGLTAPIALYNLTDLTDVSGNARALTNKGSVTFGSGITGATTEAAIFTGSTAQALYIADTGAGDPFRISYGSVGFWFKTAKTGTSQYLISKHTSTQSVVCWGLKVDSTNVIKFSLSTSGSALASTSPLGTTNVTDDRWHFVVGTYDGAVALLYIDGVLEGMDYSLTGPLFGGAAPFNIGGYGADGSTASVNPSYGRMDEAFVTSDVLSLEQIRMLYAMRITHGAPAAPIAADLRVLRTRRGGALAASDFSSTPKYLYNFTAGALTSAGSLANSLTNNATAVACPGADGSLGNAFNFVAASSQYLSATDTGLPSGTSARSLGAWFKSTAAAQSFILQYGTDGFPAVYFDGSGLYQGLTGKVVNDGQWHFGVVVHDPSAADGIFQRYYLDGKFVGGSTSTSSVSLAGASGLNIGRRQTATNYLTGQIDTAFVTDYAISSDEIAKLYNKGSLALETSPINAGSSIEGIDSTYVYAIFDADIPSNHQISLNVGGGAGVANTVGVQKNDVIVGSRSAVDFEDTTALTWTVTDDPTNNRVKVTPVLTTGIDGWTTVSGTFTYSSTDGPTFVVSTPSDLTGVIPVGARFKCTQSSVVVYFIVTAISSTTMTLYGGTDYTLANSAISSPSFSVAKAPVGFPLSPLKWTESVSSASDSSQASPTNFTWYNLGGSLSIPIGIWNVEYEAEVYMLQVSATGNGEVSARSTLSTANNSQSDTDFSAETSGYFYISADQAYVRGSHYRRKYLSLSSKTTYYLNAAGAAGQGNSSLQMIGSRSSPKIIRAVCAYL